jgi:putative sigma-54 modulation protein
MQIAVTFRHIEADEGIKDYVKDKVEKLQRYIENPREIHVVLSAEKFRHIAEMTVIADGVTLNSEGRNSDLYTAIDQMVDKVERQVRERRGKEKRKRSTSLPDLTSPESEGEEFEGKEDQEILSTIRRKRILAKPMSLEEAVAQLRLSDEDIVVFVNSDSGLMNALYRRKDGSYEWVEPRAK